MEWIKDTYATLANMNMRQLLTQFVSLGLIVTSALMIWKSMILVTGSESPVVVVLSGSMEPGFYRGDILFLYMGYSPIRIGDVVVFNIMGRDIPIVHRVIKLHERRATELDDAEAVVSPAIDLGPWGRAGSGGWGQLGSRGDAAAQATAELDAARATLPLSRQDVLTKGDNNYGDDKVLYAKGQEWLHRRHVMGRAVGYLPYVGMLTIIMNDYPYAKVLLIVLLCLLVVTSRD